MTDFYKSCPLKTLSITARHDFLSLVAHNLFFAISPTPCFAISWRLMIVTGRVWLELSFTTDKRHCNMQHIRDRQRHLTDVQKLQVISADFWGSSYKGKRHLLLPWNQTAPHSSSCRRTLELGGLSAWALDQEVVSQVFRVDRFPSGANLIEKSKLPALYKRFLISNSTDRIEVSMAPAMDIHRETAWSDVTESWTKF